MISFIVLIGMRIAHRPVDRKFPFGYHKLESFGALIAAIGIIAIAGFILWYRMLPCCRAQARLILTRTLIK